MFKPSMDMYSESVPIIPGIAAVLTAGFTSSLLAESTNYCTAIIVGGCYGAGVGMVMDIGMKGWYYTDINKN